MESSQEISEIASALAKAQGAMKPASKDKDNPFFKKKYADLESCWDACRIPLSSNGLSIVQPVSVGENGEIIITTLLMHISGQWIKDALHLKPVKSDPQGIGSVITYGRRYGLMGMVGIAPAEDDGEAAMGRGENSIQSLYERIKALSSPEQFLSAKKEISNINSEQERKKLGAAFNERMRLQGIAYNQSDGSFSVKDLDWYETEAEKQEDVIGWWKKEHQQASRLLSEKDLAKMERFVSQLFDIINNDKDNQK